MNWARGTHRQALVLASAWLAGCSCQDGSTGPAVLADLAHVFPLDHLAEAQLETSPAPALPSGVSLGRVRGGVVALSLELAAKDAVELTRDPLLIYTWNLPWTPSGDDHGGSLAASIDGMQLDRVDLTRAAQEPRSGFAVVGEQLLLAPGEEPLPDTLRLTYPVRAAQFAHLGELGEEPLVEVLRGRHIEGSSATEALYLPTGSVLRLGLHAPGARELRLAAAHELGSSGLQLELQAEGEALLVELAPTAPAQDLRLPVSADPDGRVQLSLSVTGAPGQLARLQTPVLARPRAAGDPPNLILVLVDTLRGDRVGAAGGTLGLTPEIDAFAADALSYEQCWATCSWTLPSLSTILTSNHGGQHQAHHSRRRLGRGLDTLAEVLRTQGYQPRAVTDGVFFSQGYGLDRGFSTLEAFDHPRSSGIEQTLARADELLDELGAGPWFLLLHTYEVHGPYLPPVYDSVVSRHGGPPSLGPEPHLYFDDIEAENGVLDQVRPVLEELYDEGVRHLDQTLGPWLNELATSGALDGTAVCLTSDHGEEFGEHGSLGHADTLYAEQLHVPLIVRAPGGGIAGGARTQPVSQLDLAPTLLDVLGLGELITSTTFVGRSLLGAERSPIYASRAHPEKSTLEALRAGSQVWIEGPYHLERAGWPGAEPEVYELGRDPLQRDNLHASDAYSTLQQQFLRARQTYSEPRTTESEASPDAALQEQLNDAGYDG